MKLYGASLSPFVRKAAVFLEEKGIDWTHIPVGLGSGDPDFLECSPFKKIPGFSDGDYKLSDSTAICVYVDAKHPDPSLIPAEAKARGKTIWWDEIADTVLVAAGGKIFFNRVVAPRFLGRDGDEALAKQGEQEMVEFLEFLEPRIPDAGAFLVGDALTLADIALASPFANTRYAGFDIPETFGRTTAWVDAMFARPSFAALLAKDRKAMGG